MNVNTASNVLVDFAGKTFTKTFGAICHAFKESSNRDVQRSQGNYGPSWAPRDVISVTKYNPLLKPADSKSFESSQNEVKKPVSIRNINDDITNAKKQHSLSGCQAIYPNLDLEFLKQGLIPPNR